jgi:superfamily II DNA or RNA helicase
MPTGTGKTQVFVALASLAKKGRVLMLAHRDELVGQAVTRIWDQLGVVAGVEKAERRAVRTAGSGAQQIVVGSVQTLQNTRLRQWPTNAFSLVVIDEAHHAAARSYQAIVKHFAGARVVGVTATPDRGDGRGLGRYFDSVAYEYGIGEAITDGWLVEPSVWRIHIDEVDLGEVPRRAGDLVGSILDEEIAKGVHAAARVLLDRADDRQTLIFTPGVATAHDLVEVLCAARPRCAAAIDGTTPTEQRRSILTAHATGVIQYLVNYQVLTEGYDSPTISCLGLLRPTFSRGLYTQMLGRGLRPWPGKNNCLVLDFTDSSGRLDLVGPEDILGGSDATAIKEAKKATENAEEPVRITEALAKAKAIVKYRKEQMEVRKRKQKQRKRLVIDDALRLLSMGRSGDQGGRKATEKQITALERFGVECDEVSLKVASELLDSLISRSRAGLATLGQLRVLKKYGHTAKTLTRDEASGAIDYIAAQGWRRR